MPWLPELHTVDEDCAYFAARIDDSTGWVAVEDETVVGFVLCDQGWINHLYVDVGHQGSGVGSELLARAIEHEGASVELWAFQRNVQAREFYFRRGFAEEEMTDGSGNQENEPDVRLRLRG